jgi:hypothetical protein
LTAAGPPGKFAASDSHTKDPLATHKENLKIQFWNTLVLPFYDQLDRFLGKIFSPFIFFLPASPWNFSQEEQPNWRRA